jgi:DNA mismatch repair ATPase MutS
MPPEFTDSSTKSVLGTRAFLEQFNPDSKAGEKLAATLRFFAPGDQDAWREEMERLVEVEAWCEPGLSSSEVSSEKNIGAGEEHLRAALGELPLLARPLRKLRAGEVLGEAELFTLKRFLYYGGEAVNAALDLVDGWGVPANCPEQIFGLMEMIHPQKRLTPRFHLASELSEELEALRLELRQKKKRERLARAEIEEAIVVDHGGTFDIHGTFRPGTLRSTDEASKLAQDALIQDQRLEQSPSGWKLADAEIKALTAELERVQAQVEDIEYDLRARLSDRLRDETEWLAQIAQTLAVLDVRLAKVRLRREIGGCWARWRDLGEERGQSNPGILLEAGREPRISSRLTREQVQPVGVALGDEPVVVTGPNMGGKSVLLRLIGICQWCAQHALPVPAERCDFSPVHAIVYVGSEEPLAEDVTEGLSSFGREVKRLVDWWERGEGPKLWLLDELGRGTHPDEGAKIATRVIETLARRGDRVVAATHFPAVALLESAQKLRIAGLTDPGTLEELLAAGYDVQDALREAMDYRPVAVDTHDVPRDATVVARALGLDL